MNKNVKVVFIDGNFLEGQIEETQGFLKVQWIRLITSDGVVDVNMDHVQYMVDMDAKEIK